MATTKKKASTSARVRASKPAAQESRPRQSRVARAVHAASSCWSQRARGRGCSTATLPAEAGASMGRTFSATSCTIWCSTRATDARCSRPRRPATWARRSSVRPISAGPGRKPRSRRRSTRSATTAAAASSITPSGSRPATRASPASGTPALRRRDCSARTTAASPGAGLADQRRSAVHRVDGHRAGRHAGRAEDAFDHRRSARSEAPLLRHVGRRRARVARRRQDVLRC